VTEAKKAAPFIFFLYFFIIVCQKSQWDKHM